MNYRLILSLLIGYLVLDLGFAIILYVKDPITFNKIARESYGKEVIIAFIFAMIVGLIVYNYVSQ